MSMSIHVHDPPCSLRSEKAACLAQLTERLGDLGGRVGRGGRAGRRGGKPDTGTCLSPGVRQSPHHSWHRPDRQARRQAHLPQWTDCSDCSTHANPIGDQSKASHESVLGKVGL